MTNVAHDFCGEIVFGAKDASSNEVALDFAKPDFNLVEPGGVGGGVMQGEIGIGRQKFGDAFGLVGREVIDNGVNSFARRLGGDQLVQKGDKLGAGVPLSHLAQDLAALGFQRGVEREGAMAKVFKTVPFRPTRGEWQHGVEPVESLDGALFIYAEDRGIERRLEIECDDIGRFGFEIGVVTRHVTTQTVRLQSDVGPHSRHARLICAQRSGQRSRAPLGGSAHGFAMQGPVHDARVKLLASGSRLPSTMPTEQSRESFGREALPPQFHSIDAALLLGTELAQRGPLGKSKDNSRPATVFTSGASALGHLPQSPSFRWTDHKSTCHTSHDTLAVSELNDSPH